MKRNLSWKELLGGGIFCYLIGQYVIGSDSVVGSAIGTLALILILLGAVNLIQAVFKRH